MRKLQQQISPVLAALLILAAFSGQGGCSGIQPGNDPVVVDAEKTTSIAVETLNTFFKLEFDNQALILERAPAIHTYANYARRNSPQWIASARALTITYKTNRTPENKANLETALAVLSEAIAQVSKYTTQIHSIK
jgi:hypothetical protein